MLNFWEKEKQLRKVSNFKIARLRAKLYLGQNAELMISSRKSKKYMIRNPHTNEMMHFGDINYSDFLKTGDEYKRALYLKRAKGIAGEWQKDPYSPNNLSINILW